MVTYEQLKKIAPRGKDDILKAVAEGLNEYGNVFGLNTPLRLAHFIGQCAHESDSFSTTKEYGGTKARYAPHYGRGIIQTTWPENYEKFTAWCKKHGLSQINFAAKSNLDKVAQFPWAFLSAVCYWDMNNLNRFADADDVKGLTKAINGGYNGLEDRIAYTDKAKAVLGVSAVYDKKSYDASDIQRALRAKGYDIAVDGIIGLRTIAAIRLFQKFNGLAVDGVVGPQTAKALGLV